MKNQHVCNIPMRAIAIYSVDSWQGSGRLQNAGSSMIPTAIQRIVGRCRSSERRLNVIHSVKKVQTRLRFNKMQR